MTEKTADVLSDPADEHPSELALIRLRQRELEAETERALAAHLACCAACRKRLEGMAGEAAAFLERYPMASVLQAQRSPSSTPPFAAWRRLFAMPRFRIAAAACLGSILLLGVTALLSRRVAAPPAISADERIKGGLIQWVVKRGEAQLVAGTDFQFRAGDEIGLLVLAAHPGQLKVFSVDERGAIEELIPAPGEPALAIQPGKRTVSPFSLHLEAPMSARRLFALFATASPDRSRLQRLAAEEMRRLRGEGKGIEQLTTLPCPGHVESRFIPRLGRGVEENR